MMKDFYGDTFKLGEPVHALYQSTLYRAIVVGVFNKSIKLMFIGWRGNSWVSRKTWTDTSVVRASSDQIHKLMQDDTFKQEFKDVQSRIPKDG